eukprot:CAMPEP_0205936178 /NCGR_PEP_ID=MMETSP1325-20131115/40922_1 /ASSEMBLY_ACC=CAM_ASM_000708 /TAXON_ID=236786 /ORGANISM="Florenciella sp., Strain RCC1007" /LENGTH=64 /DNA_ID=CAMNT_0053306317 /DNA_START=42 /DNA_END=233 /DNA_ORIENTATION=-
MGKNQLALVLDRILSLVALAHHRPCFHPCGRTLTARSHVHFELGGARLFERDEAVVLLALHLDP